MAVPKKIINFLEKEKAVYKLTEHRKVYTAFDKSRTLKVPEKTIAKTLVLRSGKDLILAAVGADKNIDLKKIQSVVGNKTAIVSEKLIKNRLKGVKIGAVPPFGGLWKMPVFMDRKLAKEKEILISSGDYNFSFKIKPKVLQKINPGMIIGDFGRKKK